MSIKGIFKRWMNPSVAILHAEQIDIKNQLALLKDQISDPDQIKIINSCEEYIAELETTIDNRQIASAWRLLHRIQEEILLLVSPAQLTSEGQRVIQSMQLSALSDAVKKDWIDKLKDSIAKIENNGKYEEMKSRQLIKMAANVINDYTDDSFWDIWTKRWMSFIYLFAIALILIDLAASYNNKLISPNAQLSLNLVMLLGALGGFASGIWGSSQEYFAKGYFWVNTLYYAFVRPVAGIIAAIVMFWLLMGQAYIKVDPPLAPYQIAPFYSKCKDSGLISKCTPTVLMNSQSTDIMSTSTSTNENTLITFKAPKGMSIFLYMLLLLIAGFAGDRLLKSVTDKVMTKLFNEAEKTKDASKSGT